LTAKFVTSSPAKEGHPWNIAGGSQWSLQSSRKHRLAQVRGGAGGPREWDAKRGKKGGDPQIDDEGRKGASSTVVTPPVLTAPHIASFTLATATFLHSLRGEASKTLLRFTLLLAAVSSIFFDPEGGMVMSLPVGVIRGNRRLLPPGVVSKITRSIRRKGYLATLDDGVITNAWIRGVGPGPKLGFSMLVLSYISTLKTRTKAATDFVEATAASSVITNYAYLVLTPILLTSIAFLVGTETNPLRFLWLVIPTIACEVLVTGMVLREAVSDLIMGNEGGAESKIYACGLVMFSLRRAMTLL